MSAMSSTSRLSLTQLPRRDRLGVTVGGGVATWVTRSDYAAWPHGRSRSVPDRSARERVYGDGSAPAAGRLRGGAAEALPLAEWSAAPESGESRRQTSS